MKEASRRVGIDWGSESHQVCRIDGEKEPKQRSFPHTGEGLKALVAFVIEGELDPELIAVAIEVNHGAVVEALLAKGLRVYSINPKLLDRLRDRFSIRRQARSSGTPVRPTARTRPGRRRHADHPWLPPWKIDRVVDPATSD